MTTDDIKKKIEQAIPGSRAQVAGSDAHYEALVVADAFEGKSLIERHQMVYAAVQEEMRSEAIHALSLRTVTAAETR